MSLSNITKAAQNVARAFFRQHKKVNGAVGSKRDHAKETSVSQTLDSVLHLIDQDGHRSILIVGSREFFESVGIAAPHLHLKWASCNVSDVLSGAANPGETDITEADAIICGGADVVAAYRIAVSLMAASYPGRPVHWVANNWEYCGGTFPVPSRVDDCEAVLFNHFRHFFGIKDSLQFRIEIYLGTTIKRSYRILRQDESLILRLSDFISNRDSAASFAVFVSHPTLTRGRHNRLRLCADVFWRNSLTTMHGVHEFNRSPDHKVEFRLSTAAVDGGDVILTIPNYALDLGTNQDVTVVVDGHVQMQHRDRAYRIGESCISADTLSGSRFVGWKYAGYGGSNWFSLRPGIGPGGSIAGNHHASVPIAPLQDMSMDTAEKQQISKLRSLGYFVEPYVLPVALPHDELRFGFDCGAANPSFQDFIVHAFDSKGALLSERSYAKLAPGPVFSNELPSVVSDQNVAMVMVTPDFEKIGYRRKGFKLQFDLIAQHKGSGDWDVTEGQSSWRNVGLFVPGAPHFAGIAGSVTGRTNLVARARYNKGFRTAIVASHASGRLTYKSSADLTLTVLNLQGDQRSANVSIPSFTWACKWLDELWPDLDQFLGSTGLGPLLATSMDADINCQIVTISRNGAISLQHMWGY